MAENKELINNLGNLAQLDIDAVNAYEQALGNIEVSSIRQRIEEFKGDHQRHVDELTQAIRRLGGEAPSPGADVKGFVLQGFTAIASKTGTEGALKAMQGNEKLTNKTYDDALSWNLPNDIRQIVERNRDDERRHLDYIEKALRDRTWEQRPQP